MVRPRRARASGFTVIELLISLVVIGIMAATIAPSLTELLADNRSASAAMEVVRVARHARAQARATGLAQLVLFSNDDATGSLGLGTLRTYAGMNTKCRQTPWQATITPAANTGLGPSHVFDMADFNPRDGVARPDKDDMGRHVIVLRARVNTEAAALEDQYAVCYQPNGEVFAGDPLPLEPQTQPILFEIRRTIDGTDRGRLRQVVLPVGGNARPR
jgi:prepilin-type N-terminal cleavage/methylation domain-containing protein